MSLKGDLSDQKNHDLLCKEEYKGVSSRGLGYKDRGRSGFTNF